jgi:tRNA(Ile)-lysidine synthase TilS/MesJ
MPENIEDILQNECGLVKDRPVIVGVSGGPDSLCLMETLRKAGYPVIVAYFDHQLRPESASDARMVEKTANRLMLACYVTALMYALCRREKTIDRRGGSKPTLPLPI